MFTRLFAPLALLLSVPLLSGCLYSREIARTRRDIERQFPEAEFDREVVLNFGPASVGFVAWLAGLSDDGDAKRAADLLRDLYRVKVGVYRIENLPTLETLDLSRLDRLKRDGWELAVKTKEQDESVWVLYRDDGESIRDLFVFVLDTEELVVARLKGELSDVFRRVMENEGQGLADVLGD